MSKVEKNTYSFLKKDSSTTLDTLEITSDYLKSKSHTALYHKAIRKKHQVAKLKQLIDVASPKRKKQYWKTWHCDRVKLQNGNKLQGNLCRKRWCHNCNRIRIAELMNAYIEPLRGLEDLHFVTLTAPTVEGRELKSEITKRYKGFTRVKDNVRKNYGVKLTGIRKLEVAYNEETDKYHPHFHLIVEGKYQAELIQELWLKQFTRATVKAQDITKVDMDSEKGLIELFKYAAKDVTKDEITARAMDLIYRSLEGVRTIQTYGAISKIKQPKAEKIETNQVDWIAPRVEIWVFDDEEADYINAYDERLIQTKTINTEDDETKTERIRKEKGNNNLQKYRSEESRIQKESRAERCNAH